MKMVNLVKLTTCMNISTTFMAELNKDKKLGEDEVYLMVDFPSNDNREPSCIDFWLSSLEF